ncbi:protein AF-10-like [Stylophora pistillata]|uniref:Protein AF-10 n=1 Tax=Stylophora pistillata TaxID=50429 RepID=A0A2B4S694_STYPI|nr:protein AF-10-like [Stylophora pistillata]PFX24569.1 Protein AF-10 [Stylophora pistillata]
MVKEMIGGCCVCSDERGWDENPLVYCDGHGCNVAVHQACYGIVQVPKGPWFCRKCESQERIARVKCELCPYKEGALKRTDTGGWAHVVCALYIPEVRFGNVSTMEPIILASVPHDRFCKTCYICEERGRESKTAHGACMSCNKAGCRYAFHVTCAQSSGLLCEENDGQSGPTVKYVGYCQFHWNKRAKGVLFNSKPAEKTNKILEKEKDIKEKDTKNKDIKDSVEKPKIDKDKEKEKEKKAPKPRLSTGPTSAATATEQSPKVDSNASSTTSQPVTPKQRGRKPSTVKTPTESPCNSKTAVETPKPLNSITGNIPIQLAVPGVVPLSTLPVQSGASSIAATAVKDTVPRPAAILGPEMLPKSVSSQLQDIPQPSSSVLVPEIAKQMEIVMPTEATAPKQTIKPTVVGNTQTKKRAAPKSGDEPKRKVGRPPLKKKNNTPTVSRKNGTQVSSSNTVTSPLNTAFSSTFPQENHGASTSLPSLPTFSNQNVLPSNTQGASVRQNGPRTPSPNAYMIPQPRNRGLLENGHLQRPPNNNVTQGPLQLPTSLEELLEYQWEQGAQFLMQQASQYDVASLMSSLHQLKADNSRLEERLSTLTNRKNQLLQVNARLATPMSCTNTSSTVTPSNAKQPALSGSGVTAVTQGALSTDTKTTPSNYGPRGSISAGSDGAPKVDVSPGTKDGKVPLSSSVKPVSGSVVEKEIPNGELRGGKNKEQQNKRPETNLNTAPSTSSSSTSFQKQPVKVNSLLVPTASKTALPPQTLLAQQEKEKQQKQAQVNVMSHVITSAHPTSKTTQQVQQQQVQQQQQQQQQLQSRFQPQQKILLPQPLPTSQAFAVPSFPQTPQKANQKVLLQLIQQGDDIHRLSSQNSAFSHDKTQLVSQPVQAQKLLPGTVPTQQFAAPSLSLPYPGFLTFRDPMNLTGTRVDMMKAAHLAPLQMVSLDNSQTGPKERSQYFDMDKGSNTDKTSRNG